MNRLTKQLPLIVRIAQAPLKQRKRLLQRASPETIKAIIDLVYNILRRNLHIDNKTKKNLTRHYRTIARLIQRGRGQRVLREKKRILTQSGGFLPALIPLITSLLPAITTGLAITSGIAGTAGGIAKVVDTIRSRK